MADVTQLWHVAVEDGVATVAFHNPPMNYLTGAGLFELRDAIDTARRARPAAIIITGATSGQFITHFSVEDILAGQDRIKSSGPAGNQRAQAVLDGLAELPQPVIAALSGDTMGFGYELALACDFRIAQQGDFRIGLPEVRMGILPGAGGTQRLSRLVGTARALDLILRARVLTPDEALREGLVHEVVADARAAALALAHELAELPRTAVAMAKAVIYAGRHLDMGTAQRIERDGSYRSKLAPEATEALSEFAALPLDARRAWIDRHHQDRGK